MTHSSFAPRFTVLYGKRSISAVLVCCCNNDVHPDPHGHRIGRNQEEQTVIRLHTERQARPWRLKGDAIFNVKVNSDEAFISRFQTQSP